MVPCTMVRKGLLRVVHSAPPPGTSCAPGRRPELRLRRPPLPLKFPPPHYEMTQLRLQVLRRAPPWAINRPRQLPARVPTFTALQLTPLHHYNTSPTLRTCLQQTMTQDPNWLSHLLTTRGGRITTVNSRQHSLLCSPVESSTLSRQPTCRKSWTIGYTPSSRRDAASCQ